MCQVGGIEAEAVMLGQSIRVCVLRCGWDRGGGCDAGPVHQSMCAVSGVGGIEAEAVMLGQSIRVCVLCQVWVG